MERPRVVEPEESSALVVLSMPVVPEELTMSVAAGEQAVPVELAAPSRLVEQED
jgi:hypothetical protein